MTQPGKIPTRKTGGRTEVHRSRGGRLNHWANEVVWCRRRLNNQQVTCPGEAVTLMGSVTPPPNSRVKVPRVASPWVKVLTLALMELELEALSTVSGSTLPAHVTSRHSLLSDVRKSVRVTKQCTSYTPDANLEAFTTVGWSKHHNIKLLVRIA